MHKTGESIALWIHKTMNIIYIYTHIYISTLEWQNNTYGSIPWEVLEGANTDIST